MRILHVHDFIAPGNSRYGLDLDRFLMARGHSVHILAGVGERGPNDGGTLEGILCHTYPYGFGMSSLAMYRYSLRRNRDHFERLQREHRYDVVLFNQPLCATGVLRSRAVREVPCAYSFLSPWPDEWEVAHPEARLRFLHRWARRVLEQRALAACRSILVVSRFMRDRLRELYPSIPEDRLHLVPGAVDLARFCPDGSAAENRRKLGLPEGGPLLVTVRRLVARMGVENLIDAMPEVLRKFPGAILVVGGDGPLRPELERKGAGLPVRFLGYVPDEDLPALYRAADLFVLPTRELEGFGLVAVEAMACGTPVVGTPVGAIPEVLEPEWLCAGADSALIAAGIIRFLDAPRPTGIRERAMRHDWKEVARLAEQALASAVNA